MNKYNYRLKRAKQQSLENKRRRKIIHKKTVPFQGAKIKTFVKDIISDLNQKDIRR